MICTVAPDERLTAHQVAVWLNIPYSVFTEEVSRGVWDGTFALQGEDKRFIARFVEQKQQEIVEKSAIRAKQARVNPELASSRARRGKINGVRSSSIS